MIGSLAKLRYGLIFIICVGMIVSSGNDHPMPQILPLSFLLLGESAKQHNMGKVYSDLYECTGHVVPYVVVKVSERTVRL